MSHLFISHPTGDKKENHSHLNISNTEESQKSNKSSNGCKAENDNDFNRGGRNAEHNQFTFESSTFAFGLTTTSSHSWLSPPQNESQFERKQPDAGDVGEDQEINECIATTKTIPVKQNKPNRIFMEPKTNIEQKTCLKDDKSKCVQSQRKNGEQFKIQQSLDQGQAASERIERNDAEHEDMEDKESKEEMKTGLDSSRDAVSGEGYALAESKFCKIEGTKNVYDRIDSQHETFIAALIISFNSILHFVFNRGNEKWL